MCALQLAPGFEPIEGPTFEWQSHQDLTTTTTKRALVAVTESVSQAVLVQEKLIDDNNLRPVSFLELGLRSAPAVCQIVVPGLGTGSGFTVAPNAVMTNNHVLPDPNLAQNSRVRFNYQLDAAGRELPSEYFTCDPGAYFYTSQKYDFTIVGVRNNPGYRYGLLPLGIPSKTAAGSRVNIIQHPLGQPKQLAIVDNQVAYADDVVIQYLTDTLPGSSGAPVFNEMWELVAIHHSGGWIPEPNSASTHFRNEGILISAIVEHLNSIGII